MEIKVNLNRITAIVFVMTVVCFYFGYSSPLNSRAVSYREGVEQITATPKLYRDRFAFKNGHKGISSDLGFRSRSNEESDQQQVMAAKKVKSVMPGEKTIWQQNDEDDDDDDDGGEYEGLDYNNHDRLGGKKNKDQSCKPQDSVPMMIIREVDMVAMKIPVQGTKDSKTPKDSKDCKAKSESSKQKEWSDWSPCSKPCGKGFQSRWRLQPGTGLQQKEQQLRPCNLGECSNSRDFQLHPSFP